MVAPLRPLETMGSVEVKKQEARAICKELQKHYPLAHCSLNYENPLQLLVAVILSAQCTDERVNRVTPALFQKFPDVQSFARATTRSLESAVHSTGFFRNKARSIKEAAQRIMEVYDGQVPRSLEELTTLPGVGRKTANVVMGTAFGIATGVVVDTHVQRVSRRLGLASGKNPLQIEKELCEVVPKKHWISFSHWLILHGRQLCKARNPQCDQCFLKALCKSSL